MNTCRIAILASGSGSNAENIVHYLQENQIEGIEVVCIISNKREAYVLERAKKLGIRSYFIPTSEIKSQERFAPLLQELGVTHIVLAGYLALIPAWLVAAFPHRIINIHPALLPKYGGKGMYGEHVHQAVHAAGEKVTGITIHEVNEQYDSGAIIYQTEVSLSPDDAPDRIATKVHELEYLHFPRVICEWCHRTMGEPQQCDVGSR